jgi:hypothetical protein
MSTSNQVNDQDQRTDRTNKIVTLVVGCVLLGIGGFVLVQNSARFKLPDNNKLWADAWKKKVLKPWDMPKPEPLIDWSDPKNDPNKIAERMKLWNKPITIQPPQFQNGAYGHQFQQSNIGPMRPGQR